jgi:hypothetical protein
MEWARQAPNASALSQTLGAHPSRVGRIGHRISTDFPLHPLLIEAQGSQPYRRAAAVPGIGKGSDYMGKTNLLRANLSCSLENEVASRSKIYEKIIYHSIARG